MELLAGSLDKVQLSNARRLVANLDVRWHQAEDNELAYQLLIRYKLSTGLSLTDYMIAAQAMNMKATLYTFNLKHFGVVNGLAVNQPFAR